jgi:hypothetical protein
MYKDILEGILLALMWLLTIIFIVTHVLFFLRFIVSPESGLHINVLMLFNMLFSWFWYCSRKSRAANSLNEASFLNIVALETETESKEAYKRIMTVLLGVITLLAEILVTCKLIWPSFSGDFYDYASSMVSVVLAWIIYYRETKRSNQQVNLPSGFRD